MAFRDSSAHQLVSQRTGLPSNHTHQVASFRRFQWRPWRLREANVFYAYRARIEPRTNVVKTVSLNGAHTGVMVMKPGILSKSMETERTKVILIKESTPVVRRASSAARVQGERNKDSPAKESALIVRRMSSDAKRESESAKDSPAKEPLSVVGTVNTNSTSEEESTKGMLSHASASTILPVPEPQTRQGNESLSQQNSPFPYPDPRRVIGLAAFKFRMIELTCLERDTIRSEEARKRILGNCRLTTGVNPSGNRSNKQPNSLPNTSQGGRPNSAANEPATRPKSAAGPQLFKRRSSSSSIELTLNPTNRSLLFARSKSCLDMTNYTQPTNPPNGGEGCKLPPDDHFPTDQAHDDRSTSKSTGHRTSKGDLLGTVTVSQSLGVLEEFLEGGSADLEQSSESSASRGTEGALPCDKQEKVTQRSSEEDDQPEYSNPNSASADESPTPNASTTLLSPSPPSTKTSCSNVEDTSSQKQVKIRVGKRQQKTSSENGRRKSIESTLSQSDTLLSTKAGPNSKTAGKSTKKSKLKKHHRRTTSIH